VRIELNICGLFMKIFSWLFVAFSLFSTATAAELKISKEAAEWDIWSLIAKDEYSLQLHFLDFLKATEGLKDVGVTPLQHVAKVFSIYLSDLNSCGISKLELSTPDEITFTLHFCFSKDGLWLSGDSPEGMSLLEFFIKGLLNTDEHKISIKTLLYSYAKNVLNVKVE